ncbi:hypothetical protein M0R45_034468 [Rubus argutus]|uniref:Uncharacterized protein n=1 Tax=Rubus argutus TaxID=59490 RepID=A0AAW1VQ59_RUBAR
MGYSGGDGSAWLDGDGWSRGRALLAVAKEDWAATVVRIGSEQRKGGGWLRGAVEVELAAVWMSKSIGLQIEWLCAI